MLGTTVHCKQIYAHTTCTHTHLPVVSTVTHNRSFEPPSHTATVFAEDEPAAAVHRNNASAPKSPTSIPGPATMSKE